MDDLQEKIQTLEAQVQSLQSKNSTGVQTAVATVMTDISSSDVGMHPLSNGFLNYVRVPETRPAYWSLYMWNTLKEWYTNPMSIPNALRDDNDSFFLEEDIDVAAWLNKISADIHRPAFNSQMKVVFGSRDKFDMAFSGFSSNLLHADHEFSMWITDSSMPLRIDNTITKGKPDKSQSKSEDFPKGPDFLCIIPYMICQEEKKPCSDAGAGLPAPNKGKRPMAGSLKSRTLAHAPTPTKAGESSKQQLDTDLDLSQQVHDVVLPYEEAPPSGEPGIGDNAPISAGASGTLHEESTMDIDQEIDIYS
ncbi:hypothetical protein M422DRAFT_254594 [Sphaerobolus stellatus SS14]|uniref:Uncharacterized protein n=1 Tax=Sphaerobolus stellatus (strain SS14) TaxID=990650 RepID=A0A0C9V5K7_SPHS4|nr:hypothetical protein M422DRAFT_254594 [Sphaerobolus stellatus SS14]